MAETARACFSRNQVFIRLTDGGFRNMDKKSEENTKPKTNIEELMEMHQSIQKIFEDAIREYAETKREAEQKPEER